MNVDRLRVLRLDTIDSYKPGSAHHISLIQIKGFTMATKATTSARAPRGTKILTQAFFAAAAEIPETNRDAVVKAALASVRDELKANRDKAQAAKAKAKTGKQAADSKAAASPAKQPVSARPAAKATVKKAATAKSPKASTAKRAASAKATRKQEQPQNQEPAADEAAIT